MKELLWEGKPLSDYSKEQVFQFYEFIRCQTNDAISQENRVNSLLRKNAYTTDSNIMLFYRDGLKHIENYLFRVEQ